jgi:queuine tRNA-ribosyltransferase
VEFGKRRTSECSTIAFSYEESSEFPHLRAGCLSTGHGDVLTPIYMPVGTYGPVRLLSSEELKDSGAQIVLGNALHLNMSIGAEIIDSLGGLARFTSWNGPTLTDSGGYQVSYWWRSGTHSLEGAERKHRKESPVERITDEGVRIRSLVNGERSIVTPESAMEVQARIGADFVMAFDQPTFDTDTFDAAEASTARSHAWVARSFLKWKELKASGVARPWQELFPIIQGGRHPELRRRSTEMCLAFDSLGIAIAGESIGIEPAVTARTLESVRDIIPASRPLYAMGLGGGPEGFLEAALRGVDMFDNTSPSRMARCGLALLGPDATGEASRRFRVDVTKAKFRGDSSPLDPRCKCACCRCYTRGYIRYLFSIKEPLGPRLVTVHNLTFIARLGQHVHDAIRKGNFGELYEYWLGRRYLPGAIEAPAANSA